MATHGRWRLGRGDTVGVGVLRVGARGAIGRCRLENGWLVISRVVGHGASGRGLRGIGLGGRQMGRMHIHVGLSGIHAAERSRIGIVALGHGLRREGILLRRGLGSEVRRGRRGAQVGGQRRRAGQAGARTGVVGARRRRVFVGCPVGLARQRRLRSRGERESREFVARQQGSFGGVRVIPGNIDRTSGVDLRNRRQLQLFGWRGYGVRKADGESRWRTLNSSGSTYLGDGSMGRGTVRHANINAKNHGFWRDKGNQKMQTIVRQKGNRGRLVSGRQKTANLHPGTRKPALANGPGSRSNQIRSTESWVSYQVVRGGWEGPT